MLWVLIGYKGDNYFVCENNQDVREVMVRFSIGFIWVYVNRRIFVGFSGLFQLMGGS